MLNDKGYPETGVNVEMDGNADQGKNCTLTIKEIKLNSSGVYFCAARYHSGAHHCTSIQKPISAFQYLDYSSQLLTPGIHHYNQCWSHKNQIL